MSTNAPNPKPEHVLQRDRSAWPAAEFRVLIDNCVRGNRAEWIDGERRVHLKLDTMTYDGRTQDRPRADMKLSQAAGTGAR